MDVRHVSQEALDIYKNAEVIAVNQDSAGIVGVRLFQDRVRRVEAWVRPLAPLPDCLGGLSRLQGLPTAHNSSDSALWKQGNLVCQPRAALVRPRLRVRVWGLVLGLGAWGSGVGLGLGYGGLGRRTRPSG